MATAKWSAPSAVSSNILGTTADGLANGSTSAFVTYDNSTNLDLYASVAITLGGITSAAGGSITLRVFGAQSATVPDNVASVGGGEAYTVPLVQGLSAKVVVIPMIRLYPESLRFAITNNAGASLALGGNSLTVRPYGESIV